jgi:hypothetical protein
VHLINIFDLIKSKGNSNLSDLTNFIEETNLDKVCIDSIDTNINMAVPWYLMAAYSYYVLDDPILSDSRFDRMAKLMLERWDEINHMHKHLIAKSDLEAGTYLGEYPSRIEGAVKSLKEAYFGKQKRV